MKKKMFAYLLCGILILTLSGCQISNIELNRDQEDLVAGYAANRLLLHSYSYNKTLVEIKETEEQTVVPEEETTLGSSDENVDNNTDGTNDDLNVPLNQALGLEGFEISYNGLTISDSYPETITDESLFVMTASKGAKLLILKFNVKNTSEQPKSIKMQDKGLTYYAYLNEDKRFNAKLTLFLNALNTYEGNFNPNETKELILLYQVADYVADSINSIQLKINNGGDQYLTSLQ